MEKAIVVKVLSKSDLNVLGAMRQNARETLTAVSRKTGIPISTAFDKLRSLEANGVVAKYTALLDWKQIGFCYRIILLLRVKKSQKEEVENWLEENAPVNNMMHLNGDWNLMLDLLFRNIADIESFVDAFKESFERTEIKVLYVMNNVKQEGFLTDSLEHGKATE